MIFLLRDEIILLVIKIYFVICFFFYVCWGYNNKNGFLFYVK